MVIGEGAGRGTRRNNDEYAITGVRRSWLYVHCDVRALFSGDDFERVRASLRELYGVGFGFGCCRCWDGVVWWMIVGGFFSMLESASEVRMLVAGHCVWLLGMCCFKEVREPNRNDRWASVRDNCTKCKRLANGQFFKSLEEFAVDASVTNIINLRLWVIHRLL